MATVSILNIFWKEIADARAKNDHARVERLYKNINRGLVMFSTVITGFLLPWSEQIVTILLGSAYVKAWPVLAIMLIYPIHQSMGQIGGTMFLASGDTKKYMLVGIVNMLLFLPVTYLLLAPASNAFLSGLGLGALGMAIQTVISNAVGVNIQAWVIARTGGWKFDWVYQVIGIPLILGLGFLAKFLIGLYWNLDGVSMLQLLQPVVTAGILYTILAIIAIWFFPWLIGMEREDKIRLWRKFSQLLSF